MYGFPDSEEDLYVVPEGEITCTEEVQRVVEAAAKLEFPMVNFPNEGINVISSRGDARASFGWMKLAAQSAMDCILFMKNDRGDRPSIIKLALNNIVKHLEEYRKHAAPFMTFCGNQMLILELSLTTLQRMHLSALFNGIQKALVFFKKSIATIQ